MEVPPIASSLVRGVVRGYDALKIETMDFNSNPPVLVLTSGKVGSSTVYTTLRHHRICAFHVHGLSQTMIENAFQTTDPAQLPRHVGVSNALRRKMAKCSKNRWSIITLVREPIGQIVSGVFQNFRRFGLVRQDGGLDVDAALEWLYEKVADATMWTYSEQWFDREIESNFGIKVFDQPFNPDVGFSVYENHHARLLLFRLEDLDRTFGNATKEFLSLSDPLPIKKANVGYAKDLAKEYDEIKNRFRLSPDSGYACLNSAIVKHFYHDRIDQLRSRWVKPSS